MTRTEMKSSRASYGGYRDAALLRHIALPSSSDRCNRYADHAVWACDVQRIFPQQQHGGFAMPAGASAILGGLLCKLARLPCGRPESLAAILRLMRATCNARQNMNYNGADRYDMLIAQRCAGHSFRQERNEVHQVPLFSSAGAGGNVGKSGSQAALAHFQHLPVVEESGGRTFLPAAALAVIDRQLTRIMTYCPQLTAPEVQQRYGHHAGRR